jgi:hypothetical protein
MAIGGDFKSSVLAKRDHDDDMEMEVSSPSNVSR